MMRKSYDINFSAQKTNFFISFFLLIFLLGGVLMTLFFQLFRLTIVKGDYYFVLAEENRTKDVIIEAKRGKIKDRKGFILSESIEPVFDNLINRYVSLRRYPFFSFSHFLGYVKIADKNDLENDLCLTSLSLGDKVGKGGIEGLFDCILRGKNGKRLIETDALGNEKKLLAVEKPIPGYDIRTTVDAFLQEEIFKFVEKNHYKDKNIALIATNPKTGEVILYFSYPSFDSEIFQTGKGVSDILKNKRKPLFDRVASGIYPPGSVFKMIVAAAALEEGKINKETEIVDTGKIKLGNRYYSNWLYTKYGKTDGAVNVVKALQRSNDIFFYKVGESLGIEHLRRWIFDFGLGKETGIGFFESEGVVPSDFWKREKIGERWFTGDTYNLSIGQGYLLVTPLQIHKAISVFANGGKLCDPKIIKTDSSYSFYPKWVKEKLANFSEVRCKNMRLREETLQLVREGMRQACKPGGTGAPFFEYPIEVGCKTGTAQSQQGKLPHAWFTVFAPFDDPKIMVTVLVENSGEGSEIAAPLAKKVIDLYFNRQD